MGKDEINLVALRGLSVATAGMEIETAGLENGGVAFCLPLSGNECFSVCVSFHSTENWCRIVSKRPELQSYQATLSKSHLLSPSHNMERH